MKRIMFKLSSFIIVAGLVLPAFTTRIYALNSIPERDKLRNTVFICDELDEKITAVSEGLSVQDVDGLKSASDITSDSIVVDYNDLRKDDKIPEILKTALFKGVVLYLRTPNGDVDREQVKAFLGLQDLTGKIEYTSDKACVKKTYGYIIFIDSNGNAQIVSARIALVSAMKKSHEKTDSIKDESDTTLDISNVEFGFSDELDSFDNYLDLFQDKITDGIVQGETLNTRASSEEIHEANMETVRYSCLVEIPGGGTAYPVIGTVNCNLYAKRPYCATSNWSDPGTVTSKWIYHTRIFMQPNWYCSDNYRALNNLVGVYYVTHPVASSSATYKMILRDYAPKEDVAGKTNQTISFNAGMTTSGPTTNVSYSITTSYPDIDIDIKYWERGLTIDNIAGTHFNIGNVNYNSLEVNKELITLDSGVIMWNYYTKYSSLQIGYNAYFYVKQGIFASNALNVCATSGLTWTPKNWY